MHEVMDFLARLLLISLMVALLLAINYGIWRWVWAMRNDWRMFTGYVIWRWRHKPIVRENITKGTELLRRGAQHYESEARQLRDWAEVLDALRADDDNQRGTAAE